MLGYGSCKFTFCLYICSILSNLFFQGLSDVNYLPRYKYHRSLLHRFNEGLPPNPVFQNSVYGDCSIIIGGEFNEESKMKVFGDALFETFRVTHSPKG